MKDSRILSSFQELPHAAGARPLAEMPEHVRARVQVFDTCQVGVVLRAVLFVQAVVAVAALFQATSLVAWGTEMAIYTGAALPAVLAWLLAVCGLKRHLSRMHSRLQPVVAVGLGALAGLYGCGLVVWLGIVERNLWVASAAAGALVAAVLLVMRQHKDIQTTQAEVEGVLNIRPAMEVLSLVQKHRGQTNVLLSGNPGVAAELSRTGEQLALARAALDQRVAANQSFDLSIAWKSLSDRLQRLPAESRAATPPASFASRSWSFSLS